MGGSGRRTVLITLTAALLVVGARGHGQAPAQGRTVLQPLALPAIEGGRRVDESRAPDSPEALKQASMHIRSASVDRVGASGARYVPGRVIVKFRDGTSSAARLSAMSVTSRTAALSTRPAYADFDIMTIDPGEDAEAAAARLGQQSNVEYAQAAYLEHAEFVPNDPFYSRYQWNLPLIDMERAWDIQPQAGSAVTVAVLDTGVAYTNATVQFHAFAWNDGQGNDYPDLGDITVPFVAATQLASAGRFVSPHDFIWGDDLPIDLDGHGTHVSGTIGQLTNDGVGTAGVAFNVKLMPVKVISTDWDDIFQSPNVGTDDVVAQGIRYAADNGAKVLNLSIGRSGPAAPVVEDAVKYAVSKGAFVVIAAGNDFEDGNPTEVIAEIASRVQGAVSVAAVDRAKAHAYYSSTGSWVELAAPGGSFRGFGAEGGVLQQTLDLAQVDTFLDSPAQYGPPRFDALAYYYFTGTSQATPHVSGLAAMLMQQGITNPAAIEAALEKFATDLGDPGRDNLFGYGLVEARTTLRGLGLAK